MSEERKSFSNLLHDINIPVTVLGTILGIILGIFGTYFIIRADLIDLIDRRINDTDYINKISENLRPYLIFDQRSSIIDNSGGERYVEKIEVVIDNIITAKGEKKEGKRIYSIIITPKTFLRVVPNLDPLDLDYKIESERVGNLGIKYKLEPAGFFHSRPIDKQTGVPDQKFRLEIFR